MKTMKKLFVAVVMFLGLAAASHASPYFTTRSTGVCITTGSDMELVFVEWSSGSTVMNESWLILADTSCLSGLNGVPPGLTLPATTYASQEASFSADQFITPPIMLFASATVNGVGSNGAFWNRIDFTDNSGEGRSLEKGLAIIQPGAHYNTAITVGYRKRRERANR